MFYVRTLACRYVEVMSGQVRTVQKLELKNLEDASIRNPEPTSQPARIPDQTARTGPAETCQNCQILDKCSDFVERYKI